MLTIQKTIEQKNKWKTSETVVLIGFHETMTIYEGEIITRIYCIDGCMGRLTKEVCIVTAIDVGLVMIFGRRMKLQLKT